MLRNIFLMLLLILCQVSTVLSQVEFRHNASLTALKDSAQATGKLLFLDMYTVWCTPCKEMDSQVFSQVEAGKLLNQHCMAVKVDAEKGEGITIARQYQVEGYPTFLLVDGRGRLLYKHVGMATVQQLREIIRVAQAEQLSDKSLIVWEEELQENTKNEDFLKRYILKRNQLGMDISSAYFQYLKLLSSPAQSVTVMADLVAASNYPYALQDKLFQWVISQYPKWKTSLDSAIFPKLERFIEKNMRRALHQIIKQKNEQQFRLFMQCNEYSKGEFLFQDNQQCKEVYFRVTKNIEAYKQQIMPYLNELLSTDNSSQYNSIANTLNNAARFLHIQADSSLYDSALLYIRKAISMKPDIYPLQFLPYHTYAGILFSMGKTEQAVIQEEIALKRVPSGDPFYDEISISLDKIRASMNR